MGKTGCAAWCPSCTGVVPAVTSVSVIAVSRHSDPLNVLQAELLHRSRELEKDGKQDANIEQALMVTIAGVAAGMRNTG